MMSFYNKNKRMTVEFYSFLLVGVINTILTYMIYVISLYVVKYLVAYTLSFMAGILISYYLNATMVFKTKLTIYKFMGYLGNYALQYTLGLCFLYIGVSFLKLNPVLVPLMIVILLIPITFLLNKTVLQDKYELK